MTSSFERRVQTRVNVADPDCEIVISGMSGRFPNSANIAEFSYNLYNKVDMVDEEESRWKHLNEEIPKRFGKTVNLEKFDTTFFSIPKKQANVMDPQARILQEHAFEAVVDAGMSPRSLRGSRTGVFIGCCMVEADEFFSFDNSIKDGLGLTGCARALLANRISFAMDFKGPSFTADTACSSSGYALDLAFNAMRNGECDSAIVGGANLLLHPNTTVQFHRLGVISVDGFCRPFDKDASGYCRSEAVNVLFLQKAKDAKRVYAKLIYSKTNVDGFKNEGLTYPSGEIQIKLLDEFYQDIGIDPSTVDFVEAHSTGTKVGDPEECYTLDTIFCKNRQQPLPVGSIKSNMGHSEASSSINSIIKSLMTFENRKIPPNIHFKSPRPGIPSLQSGRLQVVSEPQDFHGSLIAVNSFGFGGANAHALLQINPKDKINFGIPNDDLQRLVLWSGRTEEAVNVIFDSVLKQPLDREYIALLQSIQTTTQSSNTYRGYALFAQERMPTDNMTTTSSTNPPNAMSISRHVVNFASSKRPIVFVYSGMGSQWCGMGADLLKIPIFESAINKCHDILATRQLDLRGILTSRTASMFDNILHSFVGIAAIQIGLTDLLKAIGIEPDLIVGHSVGELGCAYADGCLSSEEMILSAYSRGIASIETKVVYGSMAAVGIGYKELKNMLVEGVEIACHNSADSCTISGPAELIEGFVAKLKSQNFFAKEVACSNIPYHSSYIAAMGSKLLSKLKQVIRDPKERSSKWISSSVAKSNWNDVNCRFSSAEYHTNNLLGSVLFEEAALNLPKDALTIEIAPHGLLQAILKRSFADGLHISITQRGSKDNCVFLMDALGRLFENGIDLNISEIYPPVEFPVSRSTPIISPLIKWDHSETFYVPTFDGMQHNEMAFKVNLFDSEFTFISGHEIDGRVLFPATGYLYLAWKVAMHQNQVLFNNLDVEFDDVKFLRACNVSKDQTVELNVIIHRGTGRFEVNEGKNALATGVVRCTDNAKLTPVEESDDCDDAELAPKDFYKELRLRGYHYKNIFKSVVSAKMNCSSGQIMWKDNWMAFLDCLLQLQIIAKDTRSLALPTAIRRIVIKTKEHLRAVSEVDDGIMTAHYSHDLNMIRCGGVEIRGLNAHAVGRRLPPGIPVLESYRFVPHFPSSILSKTDTARFCVQLALENLQILKVTSVEIDMNDGKSPLSELFAEALSDLPLVTAELNYLTSTKEDFELEGVKVSNGEFEAHRNVTFVIRSRCLEDVQLMESIAAQNENVFIVSREQMESGVQTGRLTEGFQVVAVFPCEGELIVMIHFNKTPPQIPTNAIKISNGNFDTWLPKLKELAKKEPTLVYAQNESISGILGLVNCIRKEPNGSNLKCVFVDDENAPLFDVASDFYKTQLEKGLALNVYRDGAWGSYKHFLLSPSYERQPQELSCYVNGLVRGDLSSIKWLQSPLGGSSLVKVQYASLNFRDVMLATGKLAVETMGEKRFDQLCCMGIEFAGITDDGRRVMGMKHSGALTTLIEADDVLLWDCPDDWTLAEAATVLCVYATVYAAFFITTKIEEGKSILIHAGSGGIGLSAIRVAFAYGLEVFTTVSTEEKKNYLLSEFPQLKAENVGNSRDLSFEDLVMKRTQGKGVDFVLNSLAEEKLLASIRCLAVKGTFLEIGKFDIVNDNKLGMGEFLRELTFHVVLLDSMFTASYDERMVMKKLLDDGLQRGIIKPLKANVFKTDEIEQAFRFLASGKHIGKVIIQVRENETDSMTLPMPVLPRIYCNPKYSYIIAGGLGGFGLELADWLVLRGCRKLVLSSSRGITKQYQAYRIRIWESYGVKVAVNTDMISTWNGCDKLITNAVKLGPVGGIYNLAVRLSDSILENQDCASFVECMAPKAIATDYLDQISRQRCPLLEHFVVFSSVSCGHGNAGQCNYGMANSVMERIIERRRKVNLPSKAIQWGAVGEVGIVADMQEDKLDMEIGGTLQQRISSCLEELDTLMTVNDAIVSSMVVAEKRFSGSGAKGGIIEMIMNIMSIKDIKTLSLETKLSEIGMDSLMTVEISQALEREFNVSVTPQELRSMTLAQCKAFESNEKAANEVDKKFDGIAFLLRYYGDESRSNETIIKLESTMNEGYTKALIVPGLEGVGGKVYYTLARSLKYPTYLLQFANSWDARSLDEMYTAVIDDVLGLYENDSTFILIGYSYGTMITLRLARALEDLGKTGKVILIDGAPEFLQRLTCYQLKAAGDARSDNDEIIQALVLQNSFKLVLPNDTSDRLSKVLALRGWDEKLRKIDELYDDFNLYSKEYTMKSFSALFNRIKLLTDLDLNSNSNLIQPLASTPLTLIKPTETSLTAIDTDYGLGFYSPANEIDIQIIAGNHMSILENYNLPIAINNAF